MSFKENSIVLEKILKNTKHFQSQQQKTLKGFIKIENKLQEQYLTNYNLLTAQNLWQAHYQILSIISLKEFLKLNINEYRHGEKKCETCGIKYKDDALIECKCLYCNKNCQEKFDKNLKR